MKLGIDIGGTNIKFVLMQNNKVIKKGKEKTEDINKQIKEIILRFKDRINFIGIALPGYISKGKVAFSPNINVAGIKKLVKKFNIKYRIWNDVNCAALSVINKCKDDFFVITIGTGIGGAIVINGKVYEGEGFAGEIGHMVIDSESDLKCGCSKHGDFEALCSAEGIKERYYRIKRKKISVRGIFKERSKEARKVVNETYRYIAIALTNIVELLDVRNFFIGGGIARSLNMDKLKKLIKELNNTKRSVKIRKLSYYASAIGAAMLSFNEPYIRK